MELCFDIKGQTAIITGASSGLGVTFAEALAEQGVNLVIAARRYEKLVKVAEELIGKFDVKVIPVKTDKSRKRSNQHGENSHRKARLARDYCQQRWSCQP